MTNIMQTLAVAATLIITVAANSVAWADADNPYPVHFKNPNLQTSPVGAGSGIPAPYRIGD